MWKTTGQWEETTTGVITPVFKAAKGKGFIYVMVPVKGASSSP